MSNIHKLSERISLIDGFDSGLKERTGTYVIQEREITLIESGASPSVPHIIAGLKELNIDPKDVAYLIVTHIHLDHAGGAGLLLEHCPNAKLIVHPKGAKHLINPSRLIQGAKAVYSTDFDKLFDPILPIESERMIVKEDLDTLQIGPNCELTFYDTPGHAAHHFSIYDPVSNGIFVGDTIGVRYNVDGHAFYLPSTSPSQFNPEAMLNSLNRIKDLQVDTLYFGHFNASTNPGDAFHQIEYWLPRYVELGHVVCQSNGDHHELGKALLAMLETTLDEKLVDKKNPIYAHIKLDTEICAMGIMDYLNKQTPPSSLNTMNKCS